MELGLAARASRNPSGGSAGPGWEGPKEAGGLRPGTKGTFQVYKHGSGGVRAVLASQARIPRTP